MKIKEIPKTDNIIIGFDLAERHYSFTTSLITIRGEECVCALPIEINGNELHLDSRCENVTIEYLNQLSGERISGKMLILNMIIRVFIG